VTGWNNGSPNNNTGEGYGVRLSPSDRDSYFQKNWVTVQAASAIDMFTGKRDGAG